MTPPKPSPEEPSGSSTPEQELALLQAVLD